MLLKWFKSEGWLAEDEGMPEVIERKFIAPVALGVGMHTGRGIAGS